jgi:hypothetical protein
MLGRSTTAATDLGTRTRRFDRAFAGCVFVFGAIYVALALTPSHFAEALETLGYSDVGLVLGRSHSIRADDYLVATPLLRSAVSNHFEPTSRVSPYHESLKTFVAMPLADWGIALKPQMWAFFAVPPAYALSIYFLCFYVSSLVGYSLLLRRLGSGPALALIVALTLMFAQLPQVWWTQRAPVFAFAPWPFLIFLTRWRWYLRLPALAWTTAVWLIADFYPPAILSTAFGLAALVLAFAKRTGLPALPRLVAGLAAIAAGTGLVALYLGDLIGVMAGTVYPGRRLSDGGGVPPLMLLAHLFPHAAVVGYTPSVARSNRCEIGVIGTFVPLLVLVFADHASLAAWLRRNRMTAGVWLGGLLLMLAWMVLPVPAALGRIVLWDRVPAVRMLWGFGLLLVLGLGAVASQIRFRVGLARVAVFAALVAAGFLASKTLWVQPGSEASRLGSTAALRAGIWDLVILVPIAGIALAARASRTWALPRLRELLLLAAALDVLVASGGFNPLQSAHAIFRADASPLLDAVRRIGAANPRGWAAVPGLYGGVLNAFGVPAINDVLLVPQLAFFRALYPDLPEPEFERVFDRYAHVVPSFAPRPHNPRSDVIALPIFDVATPIRVEPVAADAASTPDGPGGSVDAVEIAPAGPGLFRVVARGWAPFRDIAPEQRLAISSARAELVSARAIRLPRVDVGRALGDAAFDTSGFAIEAIVRAEDPAAVTDGLQLIATDREGRRYRVERALSSGAGPRGLRQGRPGRIDD